MKNLKAIRKSIEKEKGEIIKRATSLKQDELMQLSKELAGIHSAACDLGSFLSDEIEERKAVAAKKAIEYLLSDGLSLRNVNIDDIRFEISDDKIIHQCRDYPCFDEDCDIPF